MLIAGLRRLTVLERNGTCAISDLVYLCGFKLDYATKFWKEGNLGHVTHLLFTLRTVIPWCVHRWMQGEGGPGHAPHAPERWPTCLLAPPKCHPGPFRQSGPSGPALPFLAPMEHLLLRKGLFASREPFRPQQVHFRL